VISAVIIIGHRPTLISVVPNRAWSDAITRSHATVDHRDDRLAELVHGREQLDERRARPALKALHRTEVSAGREHGAGAGQHDHAHRLVGLECRQRRDQLAARARANRVALVGAVERDPADRAADLDGDRRVLGHGRLHNMAPPHVC
jgi:hypothetical protein